MLLLLTAFVARGYADDTWTVAGSAAALNGDTDWAQDNTENDMVANGTTYTLTVTGCTLESGVNYECKVVKDHSWDVAYPSENYVFTVDETAVYTVVYTLDTEGGYDFNVEVTKTGEAGEITHTYTIAGVTSLLGVDWDPTASEFDMTSSNGVNYTLVLTDKTLTAGSYQFKVTVDHGWGVSYPTNNATLNISEDGTYTITFSFNVETKEVGAIAEKIEKPHTYTVVGVSALLGEEWTTTSTANVMTEGADGKFTLAKENVMLLVGSYSYKIWRDDDVWIPSGDDKVLEITDNGYYTVTFTYDPETNEPSAEATLTKSFYLADFNLGDSFSTTSDHYFSIARDWKHIAGAFDDDGDPRYMSYTYYNNQGVDETGTILAYKQYASENENSNNGTVVYDMLVSPLVSGEVSIQVKGSISASSSNPSFIQFYKVNANGTEYGDQITNVTYKDANGNTVDAINTTDWITAKITLSDETRIGVRGQYVYMDNFIAENATVMPEKKMKIVSASPTATTGTIKWDQQPNGKVLVKYTVTVQNTGETELTVGDNGYSVSIYNRKTGEVYGTTNVPETLAPDATSAEFDVTAEVEPSVWPNSYTYINMDLKENISGSFVMRAQSTYNEYAPKFVFRTAGTQGTSNYYGDIAFGKVSEETTKSFEVYNDGTAPLEVKTITVPEGFIVDNTGNFTVEPKAKQVVNITLPVTNPGIFSGNLEIVYVDKTGADVTYTKAMTGTVLDPTKNVITFDDGAGNAAYPQGSVRYNTYISSEGIESDKNYYLQGSTPNPLYITPLMTATAGEAISFDAMYSSYSGHAVEVMISTDRQNWTTIQTISNINSSYNWTTYTATIPEAGNYYLGFKLTSSKIDNIYGLVYAPVPEHDLLLVGSDIPTTGKQNAEYTATVKVGNVGPNVETAGSYTASLFVNGEEVATANDVNLPVAVISGNYNNGEESNYTTLTFTYKPHTPGTFPAYIEVKSGDAVITTEKVSLVVEEEKLESGLGLESNGTNNSTPLFLNYNNSESVSLYTANVLKNNLGLKDGDKISSITFKGYKEADEHTTLLSVYYQWTDEESLTAPAENGLLDVSAMTPYVENELHVWAKGGSSAQLSDMYVMNFSEPLEYEDGKALRIVMRSLNQLNGSNYKQVYWEKSTIYQNPSVSGTYLNYRHNTDTSSGRDSETSYTNAISASWSSEYLPAIHLGLVVEPTTLAGTVTDGTNPVEGATVTLRNEANDVEYAATTAADGTYSINVIQDKLAYKAVADAEGLVAPVQNVASFDEALDFTLAEPEYGEVWTGEAEIADVTAGYFKYLAKAGDKLVISYVEEGAETNTLKFTKPNSWDNVHVYAWDANQTNVTAAWPGDVLSDPYMNEYGEQVFTYSVPANVVGVVFNNGGDAQTVDITDLSVTGYYTDGTFTEGKLNVFSWTDPSNAAVELLDQSGNAIAEATLADGTAEVELTEALMTKLAGDLYAMVKGSAANITKVELVELQPISVSISASKYATLYYQNVNLTIPEGVTAYAAVKNGNTIELNEIADVIPAGVPVVINGDAGTYDFQIAAEADEFTGENDLTGTEEDVKDEEAGYKYYVLCWKDSSKSAVGFYFQSGSNGAYAQVKAHQAYMKINASEAPAKGFDIFINGDATGIDSIELGTLTDNDKVYTLSGVRVNANRVAKGVYIVNGQKVVIK